MSLKSNHKRILLMFISEVSGHRQASLAIEEALRTLDPKIETLNINAFNFTNPLLEKIINRTYMSVIKNVPEIWDYLYDNPKVVRRTQRLKNAIHRYNSGKLKNLLDDFKPDGIVCTQAFPCGMTADLKKYHNLSIPLVGVLTDYIAHSYWIYSNVNAYIVPSEETAQKLIAGGVPKEKINTFGVPIFHKFSRELNKPEIRKKLAMEEDVPAILVMGGGQGLGPMKNVISALDSMPARLQMLVATGSNRRLYNYLKKRQNRFKKKVLITAFADNIDELMSVSTMIVTKPGGLTTAEALSKRLPIIIIAPLPGQEAMNTKFLLTKELAVKVKDEKELGIVVGQLLTDKRKLNYMKALAKRYAKPDAAVNTAKLILRLN